MKHISIDWAQKYSVYCRDGRSPIRCSNPEGAENETGVPTAAILSPVLPIIMQHKNFQVLRAVIVRSHFAVPGCDTVSFYSWSLAVACFRKVGFCFTRLCVTHVTTIFDSPLSSVPPPSNINFWKLYLCQHVYHSVRLFRCLYSRSPTQYSFAGCEMNSLTQGPKVNTLVKSGELSTSWAKCWLLHCGAGGSVLAYHVGRSYRIAATVLWCFGVLHSSNGLTNVTVAHQKLRSPFAGLPALVILPAFGRAGGAGCTLNEVEVNRTIWITRFLFRTQKFQGSAVVSLYPLIIMICSHRPRWGLSHSLLEESCM